MNKLVLKGEYRAQLSKKWSMNLKVNSNVHDKMQFYLFSMMTSLVIYTNEGKMQLQDSGNQIKTCSSLCSCKL